MDVRSRKVLARVVAERQEGRISRAQLAFIDIGRGQIEGWVRSGLLVPTLPTVFALGHRARSQRGDLFDAALYAGPGAMLSHATAAWWLGLIEYPWSIIQVSSPRECRSLPGIRVYGRRACQREWHKRLPVPSTPEIVLGLAAVAELRLVRKALGRLDYHGQLNVEALYAVCGRGRAGSTPLRWAIAHHDPRFGRTNGPLEDAYLEFCEECDVPKPDHVDYWLHGIELDAYYAKAGVVVQLDGADNHKSWAQIKTDHQNDLILRGHGLIVIRYDSDQIHRRPLMVRGDILAALAR
jgi:hypothetical protein